MGIRTEEDIAETRASGLTFLPFQPPFDWLGILAFLRARAIPGLEVVDETSYRRDGVTVTFAPERDALLVGGGAEDRVRHLFDLDANPVVIAGHLGRDRRLKIRPGLRVPGCWDPFELAVRAIVGQQVSVKGASTLMGRIHSQFGFTPAALADADLTRAGLTRSRAATLRELATAVLDGRVGFGAEQAADGFLQIRGIGPWTAQYIAMRALRHQDAFPAEDLILKRAASSDGQPLTTRQLLERAERWRPWRAYAVIALWQSYSPPAKP